MEKENVMRVMFIGILLLSGCVSLRTRDAQVKAAKISTFERARRISHENKCPEVVDLISRRIESEKSK